MGRTEVVPKARYKVYWQRSNDFAKQMDRAAFERAWNSVGLLGVHATISACDALTVQRAGQRWSGQDHAGVVGMVESLHLPDPGRILRQIARTLEAKNRVEYESREFTEKEAEEVRQCTTRVRAWIGPLLPSQATFPRRMLRI